MAYQLFRQKSDIKELLQQIRRDRDRMVPAVHALVELVSEIANAAARSGENEYLLAKRLDLILSSSRGEGKIIKGHFRTHTSPAGIADLMIENCY